jgi:hypothetical protein
MLSTLCSSCVTNNTLPSKDIFVSVSGANYANGSINSPLNSLKQATILAQKFKNIPVNIWLREGEYLLGDTIKLNQQDSRLPNAPLLISAYKKEQVTLSGAIKLPYWNKVVDSNILKNLPTQSKRNVYVTNLKQYGVTKFGSAKGGGVDLYFNDKKMQIARYPNKGEKLLKIEGLVEPNTQIVRKHKGSKTGKFYYKDNAPERWQNENNILVSGYWFWDWKEQIQEVKNIDVLNKVITLKKPYHYYGYKKGKEYFAFNILAELDVPNEWYLNRNTGKAYFYPGETITKENAPQLSIINNLIELNNVSNVSINNLTFAYAKNNGIKIKGGENNIVEGVVIKHIANKGIGISQSNNSKIVSSHIYSIGGSAITINGGNRNNLVSSNICAINNKIHDYALTIKTYNPGISLTGVGNCAHNNEIFNAPHIAIYFQGNNHSIKYNNIHHVVKQSNDAGAIYAGRDWSSRGTVIKHNYLHNIKGLKDRGAKGIYLDDEFSGVTITGNIFDNVYDSVFIGGGRDNIVNGNVFLNSKRPVYIDTRGVGWAKDAIKQLKAKLDKVNHKSTIWQEQYPKLSNVLTLNPRLPEGNIITNNVFYDKQWNYVRSKAKPFVKFENNHHLFGSSPTKKYQVKTPLQGFSNIPFDQIGVK